MLASSFLESFLPWLLLRSLTKSLFLLPRSFNLKSPQLPSLISLSIGVHKVLGFSLFPVLSPTLPNSWVIVPTPLSEPPPIDHQLPKLHFLSTSLLSSQAIYPLNICHISSEMLQIQHVQNWTPNYAPSIPALGLFLLWLEPVNDTVFKTWVTSRTPLFLPLTHISSVS